MIYLILRILSAVTAALRKLGLFFTERPLILPQAFDLEPGSALLPFVMKALDWKPTALIRTATLQIFRYLTVEIWSFASAAVKWHFQTLKREQKKSWEQENSRCFLEANIW